MNKNTTILLGAIAVLAIGAGAYVSMSKPTNEGFTTQGVKKTTSPIPPTRNQPTTVPIGEVDDLGNNGGNGGDVSYREIKHYSDGTCIVKFDDGISISGTSSENGGGTCCHVDGGICYNGREPGVTDVTYGTQPVAEKIMAEDNYR